MEICQACLRTGDLVHPMSSEDIKCYRLLITKAEERLHIMYLCIYCKRYLQKIVKFIQQCQLSQIIIKEAVDKGSLSLPEIKPDLVISVPDYHYIGPTIEIEVDELDVKLDICDEDDVPLLFLNQNNDDECSNDNYNNDLEQTGIMVNIKKEGFEDDPPAEVPHNTKKYKKKVKEGFSSRMVTETNEYIVIKLTKEQILDEMQRHSDSEKYKLLPYKCETCVKGFNFEDVLQNHMEKHSPKNGPFQCELCKQYCPSKVSLRGHMKSHSTRYKCKLCDIIRLSRQHILEHYSLDHTNSAALYKCPKCSHTTNKRTAMQRHVKLHTSSEPLKCKTCGKLFKSKESLRIHLMRHDGGKLYQCAVCASRFVYAAQLSAHMRAVHDSREFYCVECDVTFKSMDNLKQHLQRAKRHRDSTSYKYECPHCSQRFISPSTLATHATAAHGEDKPAQCSVCARRYSSADALRGHVRRAHARTSTELPCPICDRVFTRAYVLRVHMRTHTGERPHGCDVCGSTFTQAAALRAHRLAKHKLDK